MEGPSRRQSIRGTDWDGNEVVLSFSVSRKLYVCPGCRASLEVGREHVLVKYESGDRGRYHQHWHRECATTHFSKELKTQRMVTPERF